MIIAIVGRSHSDKYKVARDLRYHSKGRFTRIKSYTTNADKKYNTHYYMSFKDFDKLSDFDILHQVLNAQGNEFFFLKRQFDISRDVMYVIDDPVGLEKLDELHIPYAVVFVDCAEGTIMARAEEYSDNPGDVAARLDETRERMLDFDASGKYSLYLDTSKLSPTSRTLACSVFMSQVKKWLEIRQPSEMCMPALIDMAGGSVLRAARAVGFGVAYV